MKKQILFLIFLSNTVFAQDLELSRSPQNEFKIYTYLLDHNPNLFLNSKISEVAAEALNEWIEKLSTDDGFIDSTFIKTNKEYTFINNLWLHADRYSRYAYDLLFKKQETLIITNMQEETIYECLNNSTDLGVSVLKLPGGDPEYDIYFYLILIK